MGPGAGGPFNATPRIVNDTNDALHLIREEIAIMKKLNHPNLVQLYEVLDDPEEDSIYMVLEMCRKGVVMKVGLDEQAEPYSEENCRYWFRDLILAIEYCEYRQTQAHFRHADPMTHSACAGCHPSGH